VNAFDLIAAIVLVGAFLGGLGSGALPQVGGVIGALAGAVLALNAAPWLVDVSRTLDPLPRALVVLGAIIGCVTVGETIGSALGRKLGGKLGRGVLSTLERLVGGLLGAGQAILLIWLVGGLLAVGPFTVVAKAASQSWTLRTLSGVLPPPSDVVGQIAIAVDGSGLPDVFVGLEPLPLPPVDTPTDAQTAAIARNAVASTAHVTARACGNVLSGTGVVIAPGYLVTNAHVVAGASGIRASIGGTVVDATPVLFDPALDVALLHVPSLGAPALHLATTDPVRGDRGAALGFAGGGPLVELAAAVSGEYPATGRDIYGIERVTRRILELRAGIEPGDSGGPFVLEDGTVGGIVFAMSRTEPGVGYALTPTEVAARIAPALDATSAVPLGDCVP
jgi:S1-C subfamily serine protease